MNEKMDFTRFIEELEKWAGKKVDCGFGETIAEFEEHCASEGYDEGWFDCEEANKLD